MITTPKDYLELLYRIQDQNKLTKWIGLPKEEQIYNIDLNTRTIDAPKYLSVEFDHNAETIYFKTDRYFDGIDLARPDVHIIIQYENADTVVTKKGYYYAPPFVDTSTLFDEKKIIFPWVIEGPATAYAGTVKFAIQFYRVEQEITNNEASYYYMFNLNTLPSTSQVLHGMNIAEVTENYIYDSDTVHEIFQRIDQVEKTNDLYWIDI